MNPTTPDADARLPDGCSDASRHAVARESRGSAWFVRAGRALARDPGRAALMMRMASAYFAVSFLARATSLPRAFAAISPALRDIAPDERRAERTVDALNTLLAAGIPGVHPQCWRRAAVLHRYLRFEGIDTTIVFGVAPTSSHGVDAHAWLEREGQPFAEAEKVDAYRRVFEFNAT
jgi:hypothetical protein